MAINEWGIWKKLKIVKKSEFEEVKSVDDLQAVLEFLREINVKELIKKVEKLKCMVHDAKVIHQDLKTENLQKQIQQLDEVLTYYDFLQNDADINGLRLRKIGQELLRKADQAGLKDLVKEKKKDLKWR